MQVGRQASNDGRKYVRTSNPVKTADQIAVHVKTNLREQPIYVLDANPTKQCVDRVSELT